MGNAGRRAWAGSEPVSVPVAAPCRRAPGRVIQSKHSDPVARVKTPARPDGGGGTGAAGAWPRPETPGLWACRAAPRAARGWRRRRGAAIPRAPPSLPGHAGGEPSGCCPPERGRERTRSREPGPIGRAPRAGSSRFLCPVLVEHRHRGLGDRRVLCQAHVACHCDARVGRSGEVERDPCHVIHVVDLGEAADLLVAQVLQRRQEASVPGLVRQPPETLSETVLVLGKDRPHQDAGAVAEDELLSAGQQGTRGRRGRARSCRLRSGRSAPARLRPWRPVLVHTRIVVGHRRRRRWARPRDEGWR